MKSTAHSTTPPHNPLSQFKWLWQHNAVEYSLIFVAGDLNLYFILSKILGKYWLGFFAQ